MREIHNVLFDLDGTLVNSSGAIRASLAYALERAGAPWPESVSVESLIGQPLVEIFGDHFGLDGAATDRAIADYREHYDTESAARTRVYDDVEETLERLRREGRQLFVATVKPTAIAEKVLREMGLASWFGGVAGSSMDHSRRAKGDIIRHALQRHGLDAAHSAMVGDRAQDVLGARSNRLAAVGVTWGFGSREELAGAGPDRLVDRFRELPGALQMPAGGPSDPGH